MKKIVLCSFIFIPMISLSQIKADKVLELKNVVFDVRVLSDFIHKKSKEFISVEGVDRLEGNYLLGDHPFDIIRRILLFYMRLLS